MDSLDRLSGGEERSQNVESSAAASDVPGGPGSGANPAVPSAADSAGLAEKSSGARRRPRNTLLEAFVLVFTALLLALTLKTYVAEAYEIKGSSMEPTFHSGERVVVLKTFYDLEREDVIIFSSTEDPTKDLIKRVIGLPGETIRIASGKVYVDDKPLDEQYVKEDEVSLGSQRYPFLSRTAPYKIRIDEVFVLGDNRGDSHDSRRFAGVPLRNIKGKVMARWWPLQDFSSF